MSLEDIYYIGQTIAVVAVIGSLIAIFIQMRLQNSIRQTEMERSMTEIFLVVWAKMYEDPALARLVRVASTHWDKLPDNQRFVVHAYWFQMGQVAADQVAQSNGAPKPGTMGFRMVAGVAGMIRMPGPALWWTSAKFLYDQRFVHLVDKLLAGNDPGTVSWMTFPLWQVGEEDVRIVFGEAQPPFGPKVGTQP